MKPWLLIPIVVNQNNTNHTRGWRLDRIRERRKKQREKEMVLERKEGRLDQRNEAHPLPWWEEGIYSFTRKCPVWAAEQAYSG